MTTTDRPSPYQGLTPYAEADAAYFFGRAQESATIAANLAVARLTIFYGPSGVGKSSVLRAGVIPMLKQRAQENVAAGGRPEVIPIYFNRWQQEPLTGLAQAIQEAVQPFAQTIDGKADASPLVQNFTTLLNIASAQTDSDLLIILDQFEEYFLYPESSGPDNFANAFVQAINSLDLRANFLLSLREDTLARLDYFKGRITFLFDNRLRIDQLSDTAGREAITKPLAQYNRDNLTSYTIEPELVEAVLDQIRADNLGVFRQNIDGKSVDGEQWYIETPYLQLVMTRLWDQVRNDRVMTLRLVTMNALGGAETIVRNYLNSSMDTLSLDMQAIAARWFDRLVTPGGTKIALTEKELNFYAVTSPEEVQGLLLQLQDKRILRAVSLPRGGTQYEIFHDALASAILDWQARYRSQTTIGNRVTTTHDYTTDKTANIDDSVIVGEQHTISITGDIIGGSKYTSYTPNEVSALLTQLSATFQPKPFDGRCPYVGLAAFDEQDANRFFGREGLVTELLTRVKESRFIVIAGPSGSGKSSLVRAGLIYKLKQGALPGSERWLYASLKPGRNPLDELARATLGLVSSFELSDDIRTRGKTDPSILHRIIEVLLKNDSSRRVILLVDQFEEIFTQVSDEVERLAFLNLLTYAATNKNGRIIIVLTVRSDFISDCANYPQLNALLNRQFVQIGAMQPDELVSAIALPALHVGLRIDPDLIAQIVNDMGDEPGALPLVQFALKDLFDAQQTKGGVIALTLMGYLARGGIYTALERHADKVFADLSEVEQQIAREVFKRLIQVGRGTQDTRRTALLDELVPTGIDKASVETVVQKLANARLITTDRRADNKDTVTIVHESLIQAWPWLQRLVDENREAIALENQLHEDVAIWEANDRDTSYLYVGARLQTVQELLTSSKLNLSALAQAFVDASVGEQRWREQLANEQRQRALEQARTLAEEQRRRAEEQAQAAKILRRRAVYLGAALLLAIVLAILTWIAQQKAATSARSEAKARETAETSKVLALTREAEAQTAATAEAKQRQVAEAERKAAVAASKAAIADSSRQLAFRALTYLDDRLDLAGPLSLQAYAISTTVEAKSSILASVVHNPKLIAFLHGHQNGVQSMAVSSDGKTAASADELDGSILLWDLVNRRQSGKLSGQRLKPIMKVAISPNGRLLASGDEQGHMVLWDIAKTEPLSMKLADHIGKVTSIAFSPDGSLLASSGCSQVEQCLASEIRLQRIDERQPYSQTLTGHAGPSNDIAFSPDGKLLASAGCHNYANSQKCEQGEVIVWEIKTGKMVATLKSDLPGDVLRLAFAPKGDLLISGDLDGNIALWNTNTWQLRRTLTGATLRVHSMNFSRNGELLAIGGCKKQTQSSETRTCLESEILIMDISNETISQPRQRLSGHHIGSNNDNRVTDVAFLPDNHTLLSSGWDGQLIIWDIERQQQLGESFIQKDGPVTALAFSPDGKLLATGGCETFAQGDECSRGKIDLWDSISQSLVGSLTGHDGAISSLAFDPRDGNLLASGSTDHTILLWDIQHRHPLGPAIAGHNDRVNVVTFSPNAQILASGGGEDDPTIRLWDAKSHSLIGEPLLGHANHITSLSFSADGLNLASGGSDGAIYIWDVATRQKKYGYYAAPGESGPDVVAFSPTITRSLISGSLVEPNPAIWNLDPILWKPAPAAWQDSSRWESFSISRVYLYNETRSPIMYINFSPDGRTLAAINTEGKIILWDTQSKYPIGSLQSDDWLEDTIGMAYSVEGWLATSTDKTITLWDLNVGSWINRICQRGNRSLTREEWKRLLGDKPYTDICHYTP